MRTMTTKTYFVVQAFVKTGRRLVSGQTTQEKTANEAMSKAARLAESSRYVGAVAFEQLADDETGETMEEPRLLFKAGDVPAEFSDD
ncbi:hypothetical protein ATO4_26297 [Aurantimonas sp. 22II-16-19i]|nr:hypothetical protein ATO4_26297 [Aurantimonas sp. 22II-16-19i]